VTLPLVSPETSFGDMAFDYKRQTVVVIKNNPTKGLDFFITPIPYPGDIPMENEE
jgi:hypothetical protein